MPKTCLELLQFAILNWDQIRQAKADFLLVHLVIKNMVPVLAIAGMVARAVLANALDPVGTNRILIFP